VPNTFEAVAVFAFAIAPGYALLVGYQHQRSHTAPDRDLHVLAQAFVLSATWIALTWWPTGHLLSGWAADGDLFDHEVYVWVLCCFLLGGPYMAGRSAGACVRAIADGKRGTTFSVMKAIGFFEPPTLWESTWERARARGATVVVVRLKDGSVIEGQFADKSRVDFSPRPPRVYLERAYGFNQDGRRIQYPKGAYIEGAEIVALQFRS
jgi:Family of unknown function (DUF6338)